MPEDKDHPTSSGNGPGIRKPTVIQIHPAGSTIPPKPTAFKPTVIGGIPAREQTPSAPATRLPSVQAPTTPPSAHPVPHPSVLPGEARKGLEVTYGTLDTLYPGTPRAVLEQAVTILHQVIVSLLTEATCLQWATNDQKKYGELTERSVTLASDENLRAARQHLGRMYEILKEIAESFTAPPPSGLLQFRKHRTPQETFEQYRGELFQLRKKLDSLSAVISQIDTEVSHLTEMYEIVSVTLDAYCIAARYIADHVSKKDGTRISQILMDRSLSLQRTVTAIQQGSLVREQTRTSIQELTLCIQDGICTMLPAWIESTATLLAKRIPNNTELFEAQERLGPILNLLKK